MLSTKLVNYLVAYVLLTLGPSKLLAAVAWDICQATGNPCDLGLVGPMSMPAIVGMLVFAGRMSYALRVSSA